MRDSGLQCVVVPLNSGQHRFVGRIATACDGFKSNEIFEYPTPGAPVVRVAAIEHAHGRRAETIRWPDHGEKPVVKTSILADDTKAKRAAELWAKKREGKPGSGTWTGWTDRSGTYGESGRAAAVSIRRRLDGIPKPPRHGANGGIRR